MPKGTPSRERPAHEIRFGYIKAAVWRNPTDKGVRYNVTLSRSYKDDDDEWQSTDSFGRDDLLLAAKALDEAHSWIYSQGREDQEEAK